MPRLIDKLRASTRAVRAPRFVPEDKLDAWGELALIVMQAIRAEPLPVIDAGPAAKYYFGCDKERWDIINDFDNLTPPHPCFWIEYQMPEKVHSQECGDTDVILIDGVPPRVGFLITALAPEDCIGEGIPSEARWILWCEMFIDAPHVAAFGPHGPIFLAVDAAGRALDAPIMQTFCAPEHQGIARNYIRLLDPALLAISLSHFEVKAEL